MATEPPAVASRWQDAFRALRYRNFRLYAIGIVVSQSGTWVQSVAQSWLVYRLTNSEFLLGLTWFFTHIPVLLLSPLGGLAADRWPRRTIVIVTQSLAMCQALLFAAVTLAGGIALWQVMTLAALLGVINAFDIPGRQSLFVELVGRDDLLNAISLNSAAFNLARVGGPSLAGLLVAAVGEGWCFFLNGVSFSVVLFCLAAMRLPSSPRSAVEGPAGSRLLEGFRYAHRTGAIRRLLAMSGAVNLSGAPGIALAPFFADGIFHRGSIGYGLLTGALGIGAVAGVLSLARRRGVEGLPRVIVSSSLLMGAALVAFAWSPSYWILLAMMPLIGFGVFRQNASANTLIQTIVPDAYRGRVMALYSMMVIGFLPLGSLAAGALAEHIGPRWTVFLGGALCLCATAVFQLSQPPPSSSR
ncbi:MAG: MFS transporter [Bryobacteraceae bacterium]|nr:MFS transporter [Bryobacteraceae bacterium]